MVREPPPAGGIGGRLSGVGRDGRRAWCGSDLRGASRGRGRPGHTGGAAPGDRCAPPAGIGAATRDAAPTRVTAVHPPPRHQAGSARQDRIGGCHRRERRGADRGDRRAPSLPGIRPAARDKDPIGCRCRKPMRRRSPLRPRRPVRVSAPRRCGSRWRSR